jgi:hypothetical protein
MLVTFLLALAPQTTGAGSGPLRLDSRVEAVTVYPG